jgi:hypothetical protein
MKGRDRARDAPSEKKDIDHTLVVADEYTRAHLEMLLAFHHDFYAGQSAEYGVEGAGDDIVDIMSPS